MRGSGGFWLVTPSVTLSLQRELWPPEKEDQVSHVIFLPPEGGGAWIPVAMVEPSVVGREPRVEGHMISLTALSLKVKVAQSCLTLCGPHGLYSPWNSLGHNTGVGSLSFLQGIFPTQGSNPGLPHCRRIFYRLSHKGTPRILEWVAYPFSSRSSQPRN